MTELVRAEARKTLRTRSTWGLLGAMVVLILLSVAQTSASVDATKALWEHQFYLLATIHSRLFLLILGIKLVTDEYRFGTIVPTVLVTPRRARVTAAKTIAGAVVGASGAFIGAAAMVAAAAPNIDGLTGRDLGALAGFVAAGMLWSVLGIGVGFIVRHQLGAVVGAITWVMFVEQLLISRRSIEDYFPGAAGGALTVGETTASMLAGGAVLLAYAAAAVAAGGLLFLRRDVP